MADRLWQDGAAAVVTGAAVRVGRQLALRLAEMGAAVAVHYRSSQAEAEQTVAEIESRGGRAVAVQADLADGPAACRELVEAAAGQLGPIAVLVNNASQFEPSRLQDLTDQHWEQMQVVNLKAPIFLCQAFAAQLPESQAGHVIQLADWRGDTPVPGHLAYTLAKSALIASTKLLAQELAPRIRVNAIAPGAILAPPGRGPEFLDKIVANIPLRRAGSPGQVADAMEFLLRTDFVTGEVIHLTGGQHLSSETRGMSQ